MREPVLTDFTEVIPPEHDLDGWHAWKQFGGLDVAEAYDKFCSHPEFYQEDFMFMGTRAFLFYFPVLDRYIREVEGPVNGFNDEAWILGCVIQHQFENDTQTLTPIAVQVEQLSDFVLAGLSQLSDGDTFQPISQIITAWTKAKATVKKVTDITTRDPS